MREIEFRIKDCKGKWHYGYPVFFDDGSFSFFVNEKLNDLLPYEDCRVECAVNNTLGQYTGLKDKNGKKIFVGDILYIKAGHGDCVVGNAIVFFDEKLLQYRVREMRPYAYDSEVGNVYKECDFAHIDSFEVIGNIYDNPKLLEE